MWVVWVINKIDLNYKFHAEYLLLTTRAACFQVSSYVEIFLGWKKWKIKKNMYKVISEEKTENTKFEMIANETVKRRVRVRIPKEFDYDEGHLYLQSTFMLLHFALDQIQTVFFSLFLVLLRFYTFDWTVDLSSNILERTRNIMKMKRAKSRRTRATGEHR